MNIVLSLVLIIIIIFVITSIFLYNRLIISRNAVENNKSTIQTVMQNRYDLVPNLVAIVKQYIKHEKSMIEKVSEMRIKMVGDGNKFLPLEKQDSFTTAIKSIFSLSESYPDLKANIDFLELQHQRSELEDRLQAARRWYNFAVTELRNKQQTFPSNTIASMMKFQDYQLFEWQDEAQTNLSAKDLFNK